MHTFKEYLKETKLPEISNPKAQKIFDALFDISKNIKPFLKEIGGPKNLSRNALWRGLSGNIPLIKKIRKNRKPTDIEINASMAIDDWFLKKFKTRFRSNAIFASGSEIFAKIFGDLNAIIIPKGNFSFVWSPKVEDLLNTDLFKLNKKLLISQSSSGFNFLAEDRLPIEVITLNKNTISKNLENNKKDFSKKEVDSIIEELKGVIATGLSNAKYQNSGLKFAIDSRNEIMISGKEYYVISGMGGIFENPKEILKIDKFGGIIPKKLYDFKNEFFILNILELILEGKITK